APPAGARRPAVVLGRHLARPGRRRGGAGGQRRQRDRADRRRGGAGPHQPRPRVGTPTGLPFRVVRRSVALIRPPGSPPCAARTAWPAPGGSAAASTPGPPRPPAAPPRTTAAR